MVPPTSPSAKDILLIFEAIMHERHRGEVQVTNYIINRSQPQFKLCLSFFFMSIYNHYHKSEDNQHKNEHVKDKKLLQYEGSVNPLWNHKIKNKKGGGGGEEGEDTQLHTMTYRTYCN